MEKKSSDYYNFIVAFHFPIWCQSNPLIFFVWNFYHNPCFCLLEFSLTYMCTLYDTNLSNLTWNCTKLFINLQWVSHWLDFMVNSIGLSFVTYYCWFLWIVSALLSYCSIQWSYDPGCIYYFLPNKHSQVFKIEAYLYFHQHFSIISL